MQYNLGVVGLGHWFGWLERGVGEKGGLRLVKAVGTRPFVEKTELLSGFGITKDKYYISGTDGRIPERFFEGLDLVQISDPNRFHKEQTIESLRKGKRVVVEKTLAVNEKELEEIKSFVKRNGMENMIYLHLHYLHKQPTLALAKSVPKLVAEYGKIKSVEANFFEPVNDEDPRRAWLLAPVNGGIFMDWVHASEVIFRTTGCSFGRIRQMRDFAVNRSYDNVNPTGVEGVVGVSGSNYGRGAVATMRMAKGTEKIYANKSLKVVFKSGFSAFLCFPGHEAEFNNANERGTLKILDADGKEVSSERLSGPNSSEMFISEVLDFCRGKHAGLNLDEISEIFKSQWEYQRTASTRKLITDRKSIDTFLKNGANGKYCK